MGQERKRYQERIAVLKRRKLEQTRQKVEKEGGLDEDDYGRIVPPEGFNWHIIPNHEDGSFYGYQGWSENFYDLLKNHPVYVDANDAFCGKWMFFLSRMKGSTWNPEYDYSHLKPELAKYNIISGIGQDAHFAPDYTIGLTLGWDGLKEKLHQYKEKNGRECLAFYEAEEKAIDAVQLWIRCTIDRIEEMTGEENDPELRKNLMEMKEVNQWVLGKPPRTLREACQWICWFNMASRTYNRDGAGGQLDELLRPYYERDCKAGLIDDEDAKYYIACLLLNDTHYYQLGGPDGKGVDVTSHLSYLILEAADLIDTSCNLTVRVHEGLPEDFFMKATGYLFKNKNGWPRFSGDKALVEGFVRSGYTKELARKRIAAGCNWMSLPGLEYTLNDLVKINTAKVFEVAFYEMMAQPDESDGNARDTGFSVERLWDLFTAHLSKAVDVTVESMKFHMRYQVYNEPELLLNLLSHGPVERGRDVSDDGAMYYNLAIDGAGIAVAADSFASLEQRIEKEHLLSWREMEQCLKDDYAGVKGEYVRKMMTGVSKYGSGNCRADWWGRRLSCFFARAVNEKSFQGDRFCFIPGWFSWANTIDFGKAVGATPDGRKAGTAVNHGANPMPGFRKDGAVTAMVNTIADIQPGYGNTAPVQLELDPGLGRDEEAVKKIVDLIRTMFEKGATLLNINIIDEEKILAAHKDPSLYLDLVVRVTGFTAYFSMLSPEFRQLVVDRIIAKK